MGAKLVQVTIDGAPVVVPRGTSVAAALLSTGLSRFRDSVSGTPRGPLCGMGTCFECVVTVDGQAWVRSCLVECVDGLEVETHERAP
ncbi:MAG: (2Fe-2S)-binding protein [Thermoplasmata archaeon]